MLQDLLGTGRQFCFRPHWQREQAEPWIEISLLAQLLQAQPHHAINKHLQLLRQLGRAQPQVMVRHYHDNGQVLHLGVELEKAKALGAKAMLEPRLGVHLHLKQHHWVLRRAFVSRARPKRPVKAMVRRFELRSLKAVERIPRRIGPERGSCRTRRRQQQRDQIGRALKQPVKPVIGFQTPRTDTGQPSPSRSRHSTPVLPRRSSVFSRVFRPSACGGCSLAPPPPPGGHIYPSPSPTTHTRNRAARAAAASATARASNNQAG
ncbi:MAG: hypothetical protein NTV57_08420 [Cyanobacteria bacterium]|nr:hypothetical protein [Cyanobacteriota bacterium]